MTLASIMSGVLAFAAIALPTLQGQTPPPAPPPDLMILNLLALDSKGAPIGDLTPADLQVVDQGKTEKIIYFHRKGITPTPAAPGAYSNRAQAPGHATAILFDLMNQNRVDSLDAGKKLGHMLQQLESGESVYFYILGLDGALIPVHPIPADPLHPAADDKTWTQTAEAELEKLMKGLNRSRPAGVLQEDMVKKTYLAFETLAKQLTYFSGERNIVWVMKDVPSVSNPRNVCSGDWLDCALYVPHLTVTLMRAGVPVNPLTYATITDPNTNRGMVEFAGLTGGRPFFGDDIRTVLAKLVSDTAGSYVLGYEVSSDNWDNKFHRIKVTSDRKGLKLDARQRYYAYADNRPPAARMQEALLAAVRSPSDDPQIGIRATVAPAPGGQPVVKLQAQIDANDLVLREEGGFLKDHVTILLVSYNDKGPIGSPVPQDFDLRLTKEQYAAALKDGLPFPPDVPVDPSVKKLRILVYDHPTGAIGSLTVPVPGAKP